MKLIAIHILALLLFSCTENGDTSNNENIDDTFPPEVTNLTIKPMNSSVKVT